MPAGSKNTGVNPVLLLMFLAVLTLIADYRIHDAAGAVAFLVASAVLAAAIGWFIGRRWRFYAWQIGVLGAIPAVVYVAWRFYAQETVEDSFSNITLFIFHPLLVMISGHFGGIVGRWQALKSRAAGNGKP